MYIYMYKHIYVYIYNIHTYIYTYTRKSIHTYMYTCLCVYKYIYIYIYTHIHIFIYIYMYMYMCICIYIYIHVNIYIHTYIYIYIYTDRQIDKHRDIDSGNPFFSWSFLFLFIRWHEVVPIIMNEARLSHLPLWGPSEGFFLINSTAVGLTPMKRSSLGLRVRVNVSFGLTRRTFN